MFIHFHLRLKPVNMLFAVALVQESNFFTIQGQGKFEQRVLNDITGSQSLSNTFLLFKGNQCVQSCCFNSSYQIRS